VIGETRALTRSLPKKARRIASLALVISLATTQATPVFAYLKFGLNINGRRVTLKWNQVPVKYYVSEGSVPGVNASQLQAAAGRAFGRWEAVPSASIAYQFAGFTAAPPLDDDGISTLGFLDRPELDRVLAATSLLVDDSSGVLIEADIFFNAAFPWSVASAGEAGKFDLETIALHEIGHLSGLGHSALGETELVASGGRRVVAAEAVMFPIAFPPGSTFDRTLRPDDVAGISDLYPAIGFDSTAGSLSGRVTRNGQGLLGAHVVAFDPSSRAMIGNFSLNKDGQFSIAGLAPGPYVVRVEPVDDADPDSFFSEAAIDLDFRVAFFDRLVVVPRGGDGGAIELKVIPK
jgi:matrixin